MIRKITLGLFAATLVGGLVLYLLFSQGGDVSAPAIEARTLKSYHAEFRRPDGSAYSDTELAEVLMAKGIPFASEKTISAPPTAANFELVFITREFSPERQREINLKFNEILTVFAQSHSEIFSLQNLNKGYVSGDLKLQLFFSADFKKVAEDESQLTEFNSSLHEMGLLGLKGVEIFIEDKPLGEFLRELDAKRDAEAAAGRRPTGSVR